MIKGSSLPLALLLLGCVETAVTPVSSNQFLLSTSAAPICGTSGAQQVAAKMAAVETLRRGFDRFVITGASVQDNVGVFQSAPTYAYTSGTFNTYGNTTYGNATTTYMGGGPVVYGTNDASLMVVMLKKGDRDYGRGVDAKQTLGSEWQELVKTGITTCG